MRKVLSAVVAAITLMVFPALVVPAMIDWSRYKDRILVQLEQATGRDVEIAGPVGLRLLPAPAFTARGVTIGDLPGAGDKPFASAGELGIRLRLWPLLSGRVAVDSLVLDKPAVHLARLPDGRANWQFTKPDGPPGDTKPTIAAPPPAEGQGGDGISIEQVRINDGLVTYKNGEGEPITIEAINAHVDAGGPSGPWLAKGSLRFRGQAADFQSSLDRIGEQRGSPAHFALRLPQSDARAEFSGILSNLSGGETLRGRLTASAPDLPLPTPGPFNLEGTLSADAREVSLQELTVNLGDSRATGALQVGLGDMTTVDAKLTVASVNLDKWLAGVPRTPSREIPGVAQSPAGGTAPAAAPPKKGFALPRDVFATADLTVETMEWRGGVVRQARVETTLDHGEVMIQSASAQLPGGSSVALNGTLGAEGDGPTFDGQAEMRSDNLRALLDWLRLDVATVPQDRLRRMEASGVVRVALPEIGLKDLKVRLDATSAQGTVTARLGQRPAVEATLAADTLNLDAYLDAQESSKEPQAGDTQRSEPQATTKPAEPTGRQTLSDVDADLRLTVNRLTAYGRMAEGVALETQLRADALTVRHLGARMEGMPVRLSGALTAKGDAYALDARGTAGGLNLAANGTVTPPRYDIALQAGHESFAQAVRVFAPAYRPAGPVGAFSATAKVTGGPEAVDVSGLEMKAGQARLGGLGHLTLGGKPSLVAELTGNAIDLNPFMPAERTGSLLPGGLRLPPAFGPAPVTPIIPAATAAATPWSNEALNLSGLYAMNARVGLRLDGLNWQGWRLEAPQAALVLDNGAAAIEGLTGRLLGGELGLTARLTASQVPTLTASLTIAGANLTGAKLGAGDIRVTQGRMDAEAKFSTAGRSMQDMAGKVQGDGRLSVVDGVISGFDLPAVNQRLNKIENVGSLLGLVQSGLSGGNTPFSKLAGTFTAEAGVVTTRDLRLDAQGGHATAESVTRLPPWTTQTAIAFHLSESSAPPLIVRLEGSIDNPRKIVDINALQQYLATRGLDRMLKGRGEPAPQGDGQQPPAKPKLKDLLRGLGGR